MPKILVAAVVAALFFLAVRRFWWWYFGIDRMIAALEDIAVSLRTFPTVRTHDAAAQRRPAKAA
jgi:uncharacterized membrane protein